MSTDRGPPAAITSNAAAPSLRLPASDNGVCQIDLTFNHLINYLYFEYDKKMHKGIQYMIVKTFNFVRVKHAGTM